MDGRKTATRRVVKPQPKSKLLYVCMGYKYGTWGYPGEKTWEYWKDESFRLPDGLSSLELNQHWTPPCHTGDILYVRETWQKNPYGSGWPYFYKASPEPFDYVPEKWRPSIHMPREAARLFLRVKDVRVERLQDIDDNGVVAEGLEIGALFDDIWNGTIKKSEIPIYGWNANPWVWVIEFERISREEAAE